MIDKIIEYLIIVVYYIIKLFILFKNLNCLLYYLKLFKIKQKTNNFIFELIFMQNSKR
jgi:hypothetical protein